MVKTPTGPSLVEWNGTDWEELSVETSAGFFVNVFPHSPSTLLLVDSDGQLLSFSGRETSAIEIPNQDRLTALFKNSRGQVCALSRSSIYRLRKGQLSESFRFPFPFKGQQSPTKAIEDSSGRIWIQVKNRGMFLLDESRNFIELTPSRNGLPSVVTSLACDKDDNIWIGSFTGLVQARPSEWVSWRMPQELRSKAAIQIRKGTEDEVIWISGYGGICRLLPEDTSPKLVIPRPSSELIFFDAAPDGSIVYGNKSLDFFRWREGQTSRIAFDPPKGNLTITGVLCDANSAPWVVGHGGIYHGQNSREGWRFQKVSGSNGLPDTTFNRLLLRPDKSLVALTIPGAFFEKQHHDSSWKKIYGHSQLGTRRVTSSNGNYWHYNKRNRQLSLQNKEAVTTRSLESLGLPHITVLTIQADHQNKLWLLTSTHGLVEIDPEDFIDGLSAPAFHARSNGLASNTISYANGSFHAETDNRIWVATMEGFSMKSQSPDPIPEPNILVETIWIDDQESSETDLLSLTRSKHPTVKVKFGIDYLGFVGQTRFHYRISDKSDSWQEAPPDGVVELSQLASGSYPLEVRASINGHLSPQTLSIPLRILPPIWQRPSGITVITLFGILVGWFFLRRQHTRSMARQRQQEEFAHILINSQELERKRIASELHDGIGQHLMLIKNSAELSRQRTTDTDTSSLQSISEHASDAISETRSIMTGLRPVVIDRLGLVPALEDMLKRSASSADLDLETNLEALDQTWSENKRIAIFRLIQESTNNVIKHANATRLSVTATAQKTEIIIEIKDNGRGISSTKQNVDTAATSLGLTGMRERCKLLGGSLNIQSKPNLGTTVRIQIPSVFSAHN